MISKRYVRLVFATILLLAVIIVYVTLFRHPPAEELIKMNRKKPADVEFSFEREFDFDDLLDDVDDKDDDDSEGRVVTRHSKSKTRDEKRIKGKGTWDKFLNDNGHTSIGSVFDDCENPNVQLGTVILLPDKESGGVMSRTIYNITLEEDLEEGTFNIEVKYNGKELYSNYWDICEMESDLESSERTVTCPIHRGPISLVKDKHIPSYLPQGRYQSKAWVKTNQGTILACGVSDFVL